MNRCGSFPLLSAFFFLSLSLSPFNIWRNLKRSEKIPGAPTRRWGEWIWLTGPSRLHRNSPQGLNVSSIRVFDKIRDPEIPINLRPLISHNVISFCEWQWGFLCVLVVRRIICKNRMPFLLLFYCRISVLTDQQEPKTLWVIKFLRSRLKAHESTKYAYGKQMVHVYNYIWVYRVRQHLTSFAPVRNDSWWLWWPNDIPAPCGPKASLYLSYRWGKTSPRKLVPTGYRTRARCMTGAYATACSKAVDEADGNTSNYTRSELRKRNVKLLHLYLLNTLAYQ